MRCDSVQGMLPYRVPDAEGELPTLQGATDLGDAAEKVAGRYHCSK